VDPYWDDSHYLNWIDDDDVVLVSCPKEVAGVVEAVVEEWE